MLPLLAITMGDPAGIGPEICLRLLAHQPTLELCRPVIFGDAAILTAVARTCRLRFSVPILAASQWPDGHRSLVGPAVLNLQKIGVSEVTPGVVSAATGRASHAYILAAIRAALAGEVAGVVTAPIHKEALHAAGVPHPGHTEIFAEETKAARTCMMLTSPELTCSLATIHVSLREVPSLLTTAGILDAIELTAAAMERLRGRKPRLAVCGLNPHAGEGGLFGDEEERIIRPAIAAATARGYDVVGPLPPDTAFRPELRQETDAYICMYHDQGLIPLKMLAFDEGVNVTLGLPIVRTSVDHGTACDIAWQGKASATSLIEAVRLAARLSAASAT